MTEEGHFSARIGESVIGQMLNFPAKPNIFFSAHDVSMSSEKVLKTRAAFMQLICKRQRKLCR